jgi:hypothetical protein
MQSRLSRRILLVSGVALILLAVTWPHQGSGQGIGSITVKLPPAHSSPRPHFNF